MRKVLLPQFGMGMTSGVINTWLLEPGAPVRAGEPLFEVEAEKATIEVPSPCTGLLHEILVKAGATASVRDVVALIDDDIGMMRDRSAGSQAPDDEPGTAVPEAAGDGRERRRSASGSPAPATARRQIEPRARRLAMDHGIDLAQIVGTGPGGRIVAEDVAAFGSRASESEAMQASPACAPVAPPPPARLEIDAQFDAEPLTSLLAAIGESQPGTSFDLGTLLARILSSAIAHAAPGETVTIAARTLPGEERERRFRNCHRHSLSNPPAEVDDGPLSARLVVMPSRTVRSVRLPGEDAPLIMFTAVDADRWLRVTLTADASRWTEGEFLAAFGRIESLVERPLAALA